MATTPPTQPLPEAVFARMDNDAYLQLTKNMPGIAVTNETTERQMGFQLGIQFVLQKLREGYVIGRV